MTRRPPVTILALAAFTVVGGLLALTAITRDGERQRSPVMDGVCSAVTLSSQGQPASAVRVFRGKLHNELHVLAARTAERDRAAAARLLEAKQVIEADGAQSTRAAWSTLANTVRTALRAAGSADPGACRAK